tara:strand:- start:3291 stop:3593 length:303 start_codon:yes stop_codon:yes gene_type:complete
LAFLGLLAELFEVIEVPNITEELYYNIKLKTFIMMGLSYALLNLDQIGAIDDFVAFVNTAGYMMHFFETEAHLFELSQNLSFSNKDKLAVDDFIADDFIK